MAESVTDIEERIFRSRPVSPCSSKLKGHKTEYSHKLTEKRRRDRMNISMSEIAQLLPSSPASKQLEKAEILEKTISYIKKLQDLTGDRCLSMGSETENPHSDEIQHATVKDGKLPNAQLELTSNYYNGFSDCIREVFHCLTNVEAMDLEQPCFQRLMGHLQNELQFMRETTEVSDSEINHKDNQNKKCLSATSNGNISSLPPSKSCLESWRRKRTHENSENSSIQNETSSENPVAKIPHLDCDKNSCSDGNGSSTSAESVSSSINKEKRKAALGTGWDGNKGAHSNTGGSSVGSDKEKDATSSSLKQDGSNIFDRANMDGGGCGAESAAVNCNWPNLGLEMPIQATPLSPRTPYMPNPYTLPTYALHPSGTHFIPVVLHLSFPLPQFPEMKSVPNWYFTALNCMRMGNPQFPPFSPGFPFAPHLNGMIGLNGMQNTKNESVEKQCESKPRDVDSTNIGHEPSSVNESTTRDLLTNV